MNSKYDAIVGIGCSFVWGANILNNDGKFIGNKYRATKLLSKYFKCPEINLAKPASGNDTIIKQGFDFVEQNTDYSKPLLIIGFSGITRQQVWSNFNNRYYDLHIFDWPNKNNKPEQYKELLKSRSAKMLSINANPDLLETYAKVRGKFMFDLEAEQRRLHQNILLFDAYLEKHNIKRIYFNSVEDNIDLIKDRINYLSFDINKSDEPIRRADFSMTQEKYKPEDCLYHFLRKKMKEENTSFDITDGEQNTRSNKPPYGKYMCGGHPSPYANELLFNKIIEYENNI